MRWVMICVSSCLTASAALCQDSELPFPDSGQSVYQNFNLGVTQADGTIDIVFGTKPSPERLEDVLALMVISTANQVRFSATYNAEDRRNTLRRVEEFATETGLPWHVCHGWWSSPDDKYAESIVRDGLGGSLVLIDNGYSSDVVDNPSSDVLSALTTDPVFGGVFNGNARRINDSEEYFNAVSALWGQVVPNRELDQERQKKGGWVDGC